MEACIVGPGKVGRSLEAALTAIGWEVVELLGRDDDLNSAATNVDVVFVATQDGSIADAAAAIAPVDDTLFIHLSGSLGLEVLEPHVRRASLHPLAAIPDRLIGAARLRSGITFAVAGDPFASELALAFGGQPFHVADDVRPLYHAAACVAANHLVALLAQVERIAAAADLPLAAYDRLIDDTLLNVRATSARAALTGPASRGDDATIGAHLDALDPAEHATYRCLAQAAAAMAGRQLLLPE